MPYDPELNEFLKSGAKLDSATAERRAGNREPAHEGRVIRYDAERRFGFVARGGDLPDAFVHQSAVKRAGLTCLNRGDRVRFDLELNKLTGKPTAVNLKLVA